MAISKDRQPQYEARNPTPAGQRIGARGGKQRSMSFIGQDGKRQWHVGSIAAVMGKGPKVKSLIGERSGK